MNGREEIYTMPVCPDRRLLDRYLYKHLSCTTSINTTVINDGTVLGWYSNCLYISADH